MQTKRSVRTVAFLLVLAIVLLSGCAGSQIYSYGNAEKKIEKLRDKIVSGQLTELEAYQAQEEIFQIISKGQPSEADRFAGLFRELTANTVLFDNEEVFALAENFAEAYSACAKGKEWGLQDLTLQSTGNSSADIVIAYLGTARYSVKLLQTGDNWYSDPNKSDEEPYQGALGKYLLEVTFYDFLPSRAFLDKHPTEAHPLGTAFTNDGYAFMMKGIFTASHGYKIYIGCDLPFSAEEHDAKTLKNAIGSLSISLSPQGQQ